MQLIGALLLVVGVVGYSGESQARLDPFYIIRGQSFGQIRPRILFLLDNSGSMALDETYKPLATYPNTKCWWDNCEDDSADYLQSRIHGARNVIREMYEANKEQADFALMTFGTSAPPASAADVPDPCLDLDTNEDRRFTWITTVNQPYSTQWKVANNAFGSQGFWLLCGDNRPFPYLRHDDLGGFSVGNNNNDALPDQPLYVTKSTLSAYESAANYTRKVQFFPRFLGRRANLDCGDNNQEAIALASYGDWGNTDAEKNTGVCGHDYYYWPYVDGNPGYSFYDGKSTDNFQHQECKDNKDEDPGNCSIKQPTDPHRLGITRRNQYVGTSLYAPFYSQAVLDDPIFAAADKGPLTEDDAHLMFEGVTDKQYAGGADVTGGTPMRVAMGQPKYAVYLDGDGKITGAKPVVNQSNAPLSHDTVAKYLAFMRTADDSELCRPLSLIIVTDGQPEPWSSQGGTSLYERLRDTRKMLGVKTYLIALSDGVVGDATSFDRVQQMACAAAGSNDTSTPCSGVNDFNWDTCRDDADPANDCAYLASNHDELKEALVEIIDSSISTDISSGTPTVANDFQLSDPNDPNSDDTAVQTTVESWTESPGWEGHVARGGCTDEDPDNPGQLADYCLNAGALAVDTQEVETYGPCAMSRVWDAGDCLEQTAWADRRLYTHGFANEDIKIAEAGVASPEFEALVLTLNGQGKIDPPLTSGSESAEIQDMAEFLLGSNFSGDWKLPGLANSAPLLIRRVPQYDASFLPSVGIRDPHCAGRRNVEGDNIPSTLEAFASGAWSIVSGGGLGDHYDYTEAVVVGDDFGVLHAFHYDSGNELFGFVPMALINNARVLSVNGVANFGQPGELEDHVFGIASTVNAGWIYDESTSKWRHLAVFGLGPGGSEFVALDVSHMGNLQDDDPIDVMWTTSTAANAADYAATLGETWSRPALTYAVSNNEMSSTPKAYLVFGSGYREGVGAPERGRTLWAVDAATGETVTQKALLPLPASGTSYDVEDDVTAVTNIAVGSHCLSRYWGEMQEAYVADPAGRLFRWDLAAETANVSSFPHEGDSGGVWPVNAGGFAVASEGFRFPACQGTDEFNCSIGAISPGGNKGDVFTFSPAVVANNRIDDIDSPGGVLPSADRDQFLLALASGSPNDDSIDGGDATNDFHSSIYLLADDHRLDQSGGFDIPVNAPSTAPGSHAHFMRLPLSEIERTRTIYYADGTTEVETRNFSKRARPIRSPMIRVTGLADGSDQLDAEVFYVTYTVFEPGEASCDDRWYDSNTDSWVFDAGATYDITFRLVIQGNDPFDFTNNYTLPNDYGDGFGASGGLGSPVVSAVDCEGENCGATLEAPSSSPCDPNADAPPMGGVMSIQTGAAELDGFSPLEIQL